MPIQAPQWTDYLNCPVCCREFGAPPRSPVSLGCGHTICRNCLKHLHRKQCPFDKIVIQVEVEDLVVNTAILQLAGYTPPAQPYHPPCVQALPEADRHAFDNVLRCIEQLALYLKNCSNNNISGSRLSRPMQRKLVTLLQCAITDEEGRGKAARAARSLGERTVTELILQHQNPQQLSANLWAAVRARGCQFLGPVMQEEVLKLVLLALEDGSALSRKVLVMFVVQRLEPHFPQASKTSIGHVVQLLYRASCFKVSKRESDSSLMQLKEEFRTYDALRREHDAQIVQIANEAGLRIAPDQWSALLYGATAHKSHMQSIIGNWESGSEFHNLAVRTVKVLGDTLGASMWNLYHGAVAPYDKLQTPQSFYQSVQELFIALQRTGDIAHLIVMSMHLDRLANIDPSPEAPSPTWQQLSEIMTSLREVVAGLVMNQINHRDSNHNAMQMDRNQQDNAPREGWSENASAPRYRIMCRDSVLRSFCPRGARCNFAHNDDDDRNTACAANNPSVNGTNYGNYVMGPMGQQPPLYHTGYPIQTQPPPQPPQMDNWATSNVMQGAAALSVDVDLESMQPPQQNFPNAMGGQPGMMQPSVQYMKFNDPGVQFQPQSVPPPMGPRGVQPFVVAPPPMYVVHDRQPPAYGMPNSAGERRHPPVNGPAYPQPQMGPPPEPMWTPIISNDVFRFDEMAKTLPPIVAAPPEEIYKSSPNARSVAGETSSGKQTDINSPDDDKELEQELQELERRIVTELKSQDEIAGLYGNSDKK